MRLEKVLLRRLRQDSLREIRQTPALRFDELLEEFIDLFRAGSHRANIARQRKRPREGPSSCFFFDEEDYIFFLVSVVVVVVEVVVVEGAAIVDVVSVPVIAVPVVAVSVVVVVVAVVPVS